MPFNFDAPVDRRNSDSIRWDRYASDDVIPLWVADMDFQSPPCVIDALAERVDVLGVGDGKQLHAAFSNKACR